MSSCCTKRCANGIHRTRIPSQASLVPWSPTCNDMRLIGRLQRGFLYTQIITFVKTRVSVTPRKGLMFFKCLWDKNYAECPYFCWRLNSPASKKFTQNQQSQWNFKTRQAFTVTMWRHRGLQECRILKLKTKHQRGCPGKQFNEIQP